MHLDAIRCKVFASITLTLMSSHISSSNNTRDHTLSILLQCQAKPFFTLMHGFMLTTTTGSRAVSSISRDVTGREVTATYPIITVLMKASLIINSLPTTSTFGIPYMSICIGQLLQADTLVPRYSPVYHRPPIQKSLLWMGSPPA